MSTPDCFGQKWEVNATECSGGFDITYTDGAGGHVRPACDHYTECGRCFTEREQATAKRQHLVQIATNAVPLQQIQKQAAPSAPVYSVPNAPPPPFPVRFSPPPPAYVPPSPPMQAPPQYMRPAPTPAVPVATPPAQLYPTHYAPSQTLTQPFEAQAYLTVQETGAAPIWKRILVEAARAGLKGMMQQGAHIVDHTPLYLEKKQ